MVPNLCIQRFSSRSLSTCAAVDLEGDLMNEKTDVLFHVLFCSMYMFSDVLHPFLMSGGSLSIYSDLDILC